MHLSKPQKNYLTEPGGSWSCINIHLFGYPRSQLFCFREMDRSPFAICSQWWETFL